MQDSGTRLPRFVWSSEAGRLKFRAAAEKSSLSCQAAESYELWSENVHGAHSKVVVACLKCNQRSTAFVNNIVRGHRIQCQCNGLIGNTDARRLRAIALQLGLEFVDHLPDGLFKARSRLAARCTTCNYQGTVLINALTTNQGRKMACFCNRGIKYSTEEARLYILGVVHSLESRVPIGDVLSAAAWTAAAPTAHSIIEMQCTECGMNIKTVINKLMNCNSRGDCQCKARTQQVVFKFIESALSQFDVEWEVRLESLPTMPFDIGISQNGRLFAVVEVDGHQHFGYSKNHWFSQESVERTRTNDRRKEVAALEVGVSVIRLFQPDVWHNKFDWKTWICQTVETANLSNPVVVCQNSPMYRSWGV